MHISKHLVACGAALVLSVGASANEQHTKKSTKTEANANGDQEVREAIRSELAAEDLPVDLMRVEVIEGRVTLAGTVPSYADKMRAEEAAADVRGVRDLDNQLKVEPSSSPPMNDEELRRAVESALKADPATDEYKVTVTATGGTVRLSGAVDSWQEKMLAQRIAGRVSGVRDVDNKLEVKPVAQRNDKELIDDVKQRLRFDAGLEETGVKVEARQGRVMLSGTVDSFADKTSAIGHAYAAGARDVDAKALQVHEIERASGKARKEIANAKDETIKAAIKAALAVDPRVKRENIEITVQNGTATLTGTVDNLPAERAALADARAIAGVRDVNDQITVKMAKPGDDKALKEAVTAAVERERGIERGEVNVSVAKGEVTLSGKVDNNSERMRALQAASRVSGVVALNDKIGIEVSGKKSDTEIAKSVKSQFFWSPDVDADQVTVSVKNGVVTLTGNVDSWFEKEKAEENALQAGATRVNNKLKVGPTAVGEGEAETRRE